MLFCIWFVKLINDQCKIQEMCDTVVAGDPSLILCCPNKYKTQSMCDKAVDDCLAALKFVPD